MNKAGALVRTWLTIDFFGEARRAGKGHASSLTTTIFTQSFLAFVFAALLYPETPPVPFAAANLCLSSLLVAIGALGDDSRPERRAADDYLLGGSPLPPLAIALAQAGHAAFAIVLVTLGMALPPAVLLAFLTGEPTRALGYLLGACTCSALASGTLGVLARASTRWLGPARTALLLGSLKAMLLGGGLVLFAIGLPRLQGTSAEMPIGRFGIGLLPPWHVARWLASPATESWRLLAMLGAGGLLLLLAMGIGNAAGGAMSHVVRQSPAIRLLRRLTAPGPRRAIAEFVAIGMWRSAAFRSRVLPLLGVPTAMVFLAMRGPASKHDFVLTCVVLQLPAIYLPFLVMFLPRADQPGTGWVFAQAPHLGRAVVQDAAWRAIVTHVLLPVFGLAIVLLAATGANGIAALPAAGFAWGLAVMAARAATGALTVVPFSEVREGESGPDLGAMLGTAIVLGGLGTAFGIWLPPGLRWPIAGVALAAALGLLLRPVDHRGDDRDTIATDADPTAPEAWPSGAANTAEPPATEQDPTQVATASPPTLGRELRAIAVLYAFLCLLPLLVGTIFAA